ncbi:MAG TPA: permease-like cell division protein FtsX [Myxococcaceae bacterium]|jgi:cell division transport system permease protein|nr:permease-like cell division protein FtsX [Myxococcaceae bacterium]
MGAVAKSDVFWRSALQGIRHQPFPHAVAVLILAISLFALGLGRAAGGLLQGLLRGLDAEVQVTVWLRAEARPADIERLSASLRARGFEVSLVTPRAALERLVHDLGPSAESLRGMSADALPASLELRVPAPWRTTEALRRLGAELGAEPEVSAVDFGEAAVERLGALARLLRWGGLFAFAVVLGATVAVVGATLQLAIYARREEVEIQKLVGATDRFVRAPFLIEGLLQGLAGAVLALVGLAVVRQWIEPQVEGLFGFLRLPGGAPPLWAGARTLELLGAGALLGLLGSFLAVTRALRA